MTQPLAGRGVTRAISFMSVMFVAIACGKAERHQPDSSAAATAAAAPPSAAALANAAPAAPAAPAEIARNTPGALAKPLDSYSGDELFTLTRGIRFTGGNERQRRCRGRAECGGANARQSTRLRVDAVDQQDSLSARTLPANGVIAVRASNRGALADSMYNMKPGSNYEYFLVVSPGAAGAKAAWRLEELDLTAGNRSHRTVSQGTVTECNHPYQRGARADFKSCATAALVRPASFKPTMQGSSEEPIWFDCALGCCTADPDGRGI